MGLVPGGAYNNRRYIEGEVSIDAAVPEVLRDILYDPQTSGGLLIAVPGHKADDFMEALADRGVTAARLVGEVVTGPGKISVVA